MISVIVPLYNKEKYIKKCLESVLNQTYTDFELLVVDDESKDNSVEIASSFRDRRIRIINRKNGGPAAARNTGIKEAKGEWILFLDADDLLLPFAMEYLMSLRKAHPDYHYYIANYFIQCNNSFRLFSYRQFEGEVKHAFFFEYMYWLTDRPGSAMYSTKLLRRHLFDENLRRFEDSHSQYAILKETRPYQSWIPIMITNRDASEAASYRTSIKEDFEGHLSFEEVSFWEKILLLRYAKDAKKGYPEEAVVLYSDWYARRDLLLFMKFFSAYRKLVNHIFKGFNPINKQVLSEEELMKKDQQFCCFIK